MPRKSGAEYGPVSVGHHSGAQGAVMPLCIAAQPTGDLAPNALRDICTPQLGRRGHRAPPVGTLAWP